MCEQPPLPEPPSAGEPARPDLVTTEPVPVDPRAVRYWRLTDLIGFLVMALPAAAVGSTITAIQADGALRWIILGAIALVTFTVLGITLRWPALRYRHYRYLLDTEGLTIQHGVFFRQTIYVPRNRIQHSDVNQGPIERHHGLAHLVIHTAGTKSASVPLYGLAHTDALAIRDHLVAGGSGDAV